MNENEKAILSVLRTYEAALNDSNTEGSVYLYATDGVFMPQNSPSSIGTKAVREAYLNVFKMITLKVKFHVAEVKIISEDWAFARTNSSGTATLNETGKTSAEANQELFLFQKISGNGKIARYCFSTTNPPAF